MRTHIDLFSGIGGFALAARWAGVQTVAFAEIDDYASRVLAKNFPGVVNYGDIRTIPDGLSAWLVTGGFPCQPYSKSGKRQGAADDRNLWPEMVGAIKSIRPTWILAENVAPIINMELDTIFTDLEACGYSAAAVVIPAGAVDAPHRRDRIWIFAYSGSGRFGWQYGWWAETQSKDVHKNMVGRERAEWQPEPGVRRVAYGIPHRVDRIRGLGNAIVPQVAYQLIRMMIEVEESYP